MTNSNENIFCVKCRKNTPTEFLKEETTKNGDICLEVHVVYVRKQKPNL